MSRWYLARRGEKYGPYELDQVLGFMQAGSILDTDLLWTQGMETWKNLKEIPELISKQRNNVDKIRVENAARVTQPDKGKENFQKSSEIQNEFRREMKGLNYQVLGSVMPMVEIILNRDERLYAQSGAMQWMDQNIKMDTEMKGGLFGAFKRKMSGEDMFIQFFTGLDDGAVVAFGHTYPGNIIPMDISKGTVICQRRSFLCAYESVNYDIHIQKRLGSGFFGGEGFIMQKLSGQGMAFIEIDGECVIKELAPGERIRVETGSVGAFEEGVDFSIERVKGIKNMFLGGEGFFLTTLTGPGKVWLQTMPIQSMAGELYHYLPFSNN